MTGGRRGVTGGRGGMIRGRRGVGGLVSGTPLFTRSSWPCSRSSSPFFIVVGVYSVVTAFYSVSYRSLLGQSPLFTRSLSVFTRSVAGLYSIVVGLYSVSRRSLLGRRRSLLGRRRSLLGQSPVFTRSSSVFTRSVTVLYSVVDCNSHMYSELRLTRHHSHCCIACSWFD